VTQCNAGYTSAISRRDLGCLPRQVTQCSAGSVEPAYATGQSLAAAGVVAGGDMTPEAALVKLGWLLGCAS